jgi:hypothetical protein
MSETIIVCPSSGAICKHAGCAAGPCWAMEWEQPVRYVRAAPPPAADAMTDAMVEAAHQYVRSVLNGSSLPDRYMRGIIAAALAATGKP